MDDHDGRSETTGLLNVSYGNNCQTNIHCHSSREEGGSTAEPVTGRSLPHPGHNVLVLVILTVSFLSALLYLALPIGVHVCLQTECYFLSLLAVEAEMTPQVIPTSLVLT